ncbi:MAG: hydantoinase B/oxoprolinase family protein, partial [Thermodesulfobacteriota bacterium]
AIDKIPDGTYRHKGVIEGAGSRPDIHIQVAVTVDGSDIDVDFAGTSGQVDWGVNVVYNFTYAYVFMAIKSAFDPDIPINEGAIRPVHMTAPEGSIINCKFPAAVAARMQVGHFMTEMVFNALSAAAPDRVIAGSGGTPAQTNILYGKRGTGKSWHTMIIRGGGMGASRHMDGHHCAIFPANGANTPVEILESDTPLIVVERGLVMDSGGPGRQRGGIGRQMTLRVPTAEESDGIPPGRTTIAVQAGRFVYPPDGIFDGRPGARARFLKNGQPADPSGLTFLDSGDTVTFVSAGGGGYGAPMERDPEAVLRDVTCGYVSVQQARTDYGVEIDPDTLTLDLDATQNLRSQTKEA